MEFLFPPSHLAFSLLPLAPNIDPSRGLSDPLPSVQFRPATRYLRNNSYRKESLFTNRDRPRVRRDKLEFRRCKLVEPREGRRFDDGIWGEEGGRRERLNGIFIVWKKKERKKERTKERKEKREREEGANRSKGNNDGAREHPLSTVRIPGIGNWLDVCSFQRGHNWLHLYANREGLKVGSSRAFRGKPPINGRGEISVRFGKPGFEIGLELGSRTRAL